ncbi:MAG: mechanosensitive ion channel family protein, partial [Desulfobacterales bacterium]
MSYLHTFYTYVEAVFGVTSPQFNPVYKALAAVGGSAVLWFILKGGVASLEKRTSHYEFVKDNTQIFQIFRSALTYALVLAACSYLINLFSLLTLKAPFRALFVVLLARPARHFLTVVLLYLEKNLAEKTETKIDNIIFDLLNKFSGVIIYALAVVLALDILGINVMPFIAGAGVMGIAIGFAAKDTLSNLIAGVLLIIDRPFEIGDRIEVWSAPVGSASWGDVTDIGLRATKIRTTDNITIIIPNNEIMKRDIVNYTIVTSKIRVRVDIGVAYDTDLPKAKEVILDVAKTMEWIASQPAPKVVVTAFGESSVNLQLRVWISDARRRMDTISYITDQVKEGFDRSGIEIPYPRRDITIVNKT